MVTGHVQDRWHVLWLLSGTAIILNQDMRHNPYARQFPENYN